MKSKFILITSSEMDSCIYCDMSEKVFNEMNLRYEKIAVSNEEIKSICEFLDRKPSVPIINIKFDKEDSSIHIGGYTEMMEFLQNQSEETLLSWQKESSTSEPSSPHLT